MYDISNSSFLLFSISTYLSIISTFCFPIRISKTHRSAIALRQLKKKKPTKLSVPFSPLIYCLNTKLTIDSLSHGSHTILCSMVAIPVYLRHSISFKEGSSGKLDITVGPKQTMGKSVGWKLRFTKHLINPNTPPCPLFYGQSYASSLKGFRIIWTG